MMGQLGLGLLSFSVGTPPEELARRVSIYREGLAQCTAPIGSTVNARAACFTMVNCAHTRDASIDAARESFEWYPKRSAELVASLPKWLDEMAGKPADHGTYSYLDGAAERIDHMDRVPLEHLMSTKACVVGDPEDVHATIEAYAATGADLLLCLVNPYNVSHEAVMTTIELMGKHIIPEFSG